MTGTLNNVRSAQDIGYKNMINVLRAPMTYLNTPSNPAVIGVLPAGAIVVGGGVQFVTAFNDSGTDTVDIGTTADADEFATLLTASGTAPVYVPLDELGSNNSYTATGELTIVAQYNGENANASAGAAEVVIFYVVK